MSRSEATQASRAQCLAAIDWVLPDPGGNVLLWQAARDHRRELFGSMRAWARMAREQGDDEVVRRTSLIMEAIGAGSSGDLNAACDLLLQSREMFPVDAVLHLNAGVLLAKLGDAARARDSVAFAAQLNPSQGPTWAFLAVLCALEGEWARAREAALQALSLGMDLGGLVNLCLADACVALDLPIDPACDFPTLDAADVQGSPGPNRFEGLERPEGEAVFIVASADQLLDLQATIWSLKASQPRCWVHVHVATPDSRTRPFMERLAAQAAPLEVRWTSEHLAAENAGELRRHLRAVRLARLREFLRGASAPVFLLDPGVLVRSPPETWITPTKDEAVWLLHRPGGLLWEQFSADVSGFFPGEEADAFLRDVEALGRKGFLRRARLEVLDKTALWAAARARPDEAVGKLDLATSLDPEQGPEARAWIAPAQETEAYSQWRAALLAAGGDLLASEPAPHQVNELLQSVFGPMLVNRHDTHISRSIRGRGGGEAVREMALLRQFIRPGDTVLDVGANIGTHTVPFCQAVGPEGWVIAFEPQRVIYQVMVANVALNSCMNADCRLAAVGEKRGKLKVPKVDYDQPGNFGLISFQWGLREGGGFVLREDEAASEEVEVITVDSLGLKACHLLKIDVEGMEGAVIRGARKTIAAHRPVIFMECFDDELGFAAVAAVKAMGYRVFLHRILGGDNALCVPTDRDWGVIGLIER